MDFSHNAWWAISMDICAAASFSIEVVRRMYGFAFSFVTKSESWSIYVSISR